MTVKKSLNNNKPVSILIAEDSRTQRVMLEHLLQNEGYEVLNAENGKEALKIIKHHKPHLIISDVMMPEMDGLQLCKEIKKDKDLKHIPIMLMSSLDGVEEIGHGLESGADHFIYKPYDSKSLLSRVRTIFLNQTIQKTANPDHGIQIILDGKKYLINAEREQILELLISSVEDAVKMNKQIKAREVELQISRKAADEANLKKSRFLASMSHEIRTPMTGILGLLELLSLSKLDDDQKATLMTAYESGKSLLRIINDILDFSKIEAGKLEISPAVSSVTSIINNVYNLYSGAASRKGLLLSSFCSPEISPAVIVDALRLQQILGNFLGNAIKFTNDGSIELRAEWLERKDNMEHIRFSVKDTGIGISLQNQQRLFKPFVQVNDNSTRDFGGTGLGLVICRRLSDMMQGTIELHSQPNHGTTVSITLALPIADPAGLAMEGDSQPAKILANTLAKRRTAPSVHMAEKEKTLILIVDDHPVNRNVLIRQLNALGYAAEGAEGGIDALEKMQSKKYALVITDCNMPTMDGYDLTRRLRKIEAEQKLPPIPIIACTANAQSTAKEACLAAGMDNCLIKPIALTDLMSMVDQLLPLPTAEPIDRTCLAELTGDDDTAFREILVDFKAANDKDAQLLIEAIEQNNLHQAQHMAHRIKGACQLIGAYGLGTICQQIEDACARGAETTMKEAGIKFKEELELLIQWFDRLD